jgi:hypothetical protein
MFIKMNYRLLSFLYILADISFKIYKTLLNDISLLRVLYILLFKIYKSLKSNKIIDFIN